MKEPAGTAPEAAGRADPKPSGDMDAELAGVLHRSRRLMTIIGVAILALLVAAIGSDTWLLANAAGESGRVDAIVQTHTSGLCAFMADLADVPVTVNPATGQASKLGVKIITDARGSFRRLACTGPEPPAAPSLIKWAHFYKLPVN